MTFRLSANLWSRRTNPSTLKLVRTYREVFAVPEFRVLFLARSITLAGISIESLALGAITYASTESTFLTALSMFGGPLITLLGSATVLGASDSMGLRRSAVLMPVAITLGCLLQALPDLHWGWRFAILAIPYLVGAATSGSTMRLLHDILPSDGFVLGRATLNIAVGVMQVVGYSLGGLLLLWLTPGTLFLLAAAGSAAVAVILRFGLRERPGSPSDQGLVSRTHAVNRTLLGSPVIRPLYLAMWIPNGLIVGCEALFIPFGGRSEAGYLFAATAAGMLLGDVIVGRFVPSERRDRLIEPLRLLLALPYLGLLFTPPWPAVLVLGFVASAGYSASLPLQERLVRTAPSDARGQAFGLYSSGLMVGQAIGAAIGGALAEALGAAHAMGVLAAASVAVTLALTRRLPSSAPARSTSFSTGNAT